jgi:hypothetical protein
MTGLDRHLLEPSSFSQSSDSDGTKKLNVYRAQVINEG